MNCFVTNFFFMFWFAFFAPNNLPCLILKDLFVSFTSQNAFQQGSENRCELLHSFSAACVGGCFSWAKRGPLYSKLDLSESLLGVWIGLFIQWIFFPVWWLKISLCSKKNPLTFWFRGTDTKLFRLLNLFWHKNSVPLQRQCRFYSQREDKAYCFQFSDYHKKNTQIVF